MRKVILTVLLGAALVSAASCSGGVSNATSFVDYDFSEYTLPPTEKITEAPSEKTTQKSSTSASEKTTAKATSKPTEKATKKPKPTEVVINRKQEATSETSTKAEEYTPPVVDDYTDEPVYVPTEPPTHAPTQPPVTITADDIKITYNNYPLTLDCDFRAVAGGFGEPDEQCRDAVQHDKEQQGVGHHNYGDMQTQQGRGEHRHQVGYRRVGAAHHLYQQHEAGHQQAGRQRHLVPV